MEQEVLLLDGVFSRWTLLESSPPWRGRESAVLAAMVDTATEAQLDFPSSLAEMGAVPRRKA